MSTTNPILDRLDDFLDRVRLEIGAVVDRAGESFSDASWRFFETLAWLFGSGTVHFAEFLLRHQSSRRRPLLRIFLQGIGLAVLTAVWFVLGLAVGGFALAASLFGLRRGKEYSWRENVSVWAPLIILGVLFPFLGAGDYVISEVGMVYTYSIILLGLNIAMGFAGQPSLGHAAFVAIGAYFTTLTYNGGLLGFSLGTCPSVLIGGLAAAVVGIVIGFPAVRVKGHYLALVTLALMFSVPALIRSKFLVAYTGGDTGISFFGPTPPNFLGWITQSAWIYYISLIYFFLLFFAAHAILKRTKVGRALTAVRDGEEKSNVMGINVPLYKVLAFGLSAFYGGIGGGIFALSTGFVSTESFTIKDSFDYLVGMAVGGGGTLLGSALGGMFLTFQSSVTAVLSKYIWHGDQLFWGVYGATVIITMLVAPRGIVGNIGHHLYLHFFKIPRRRVHRRSPFPDYDLDEELLAVGPSQGPGSEESARNAQSTG